MKPVKVWSAEFQVNNAAIALKIAGVRRKRQLSPEHKAKLLQANRSTRFRAGTTVLNEGFAA